MTSEIFLLRYEVNNPIEGQKAKLSRTVVAKFLKLDIKIIESLERHYFRINHKSNKKNNPFSIFNNYQASLFYENKVQCLWKKDAKFSTIKTKILVWITKKNLLSSLNKKEIIMKRCIILKKYNEETKSE